MRKLLLGCCWAAASAAAGASCRRFIICATTRWLSWSASCHMIRRAWRTAAQWATQIPLVPPPPSAGGTIISGAAATTAAAKGRIPGRRSDEYLRRCTLEIASTQPLVLVARDFVSAAECAAIVQFAVRQGSPVRGGGARPRDLKYELSMWPAAGLVGSRHEDALETAEAADSGYCESEHVLLESVYRRIDDIVGIERHPAEQGPRVHFSASPDDYTVYTEAAHTRMPIGLHVDTNLEATYATAILYLNTLPQPAGDGATVFPCACPVMNHDDDSGGDDAAKLAAGKLLLVERLRHTRDIGGADDAG
jgi:hypothetical protein